MESTIVMGTGSREKTLMRRVSLHYAALAWMLCLHEPDQGPKSVAQQRVKLGDPSRRTHFRFIRRIAGTRRAPFKNARW